LRRKQNQVARDKKVEKLLDIQQDAPSFPGAEEQGVEAAAPSHSPPTPPGIFTRLRFLPRHLKVSFAVRRRGHPPKLKTVAPKEDGEAAGMEAANPLSVDAGIIFYFKFMFASFSGVPFILNRFCL